MARRASSLKTDSDETRIFVLPDPPQSDILHF